MAGRPRKLDALDPVSVGGDILVSDVSNFDGIVLASTTSVGGSVHIERVDAYDLLSNCSLDSIIGIGILSVGGDLLLLGCVSEPIQPFATIHVAGTLRIQDGGARLTDLGMLSSLTHAGGLEIHANAALSSLEGLEGLSFLADDDLLLTHNPSLIRLEGLANLSTVPGSVTIDGKDGLVDLRGLEQLTDIGSHLSVGEFSGNPSLERLDGLEGVRTVGGVLWINYNDLLTDVTAAHGIEFVDDRVLILENPSLATADAQALADAIPDKGTVLILDNGP